MSFVRVAERSAASSGAGDVSLVPATPVFGGQDHARRPCVRTDRRGTARTRGGRRRTAAPAVRSRESLPPASRTAPGRRRRPPSTPRLEERRARTAGRGDQDRKCVPPVLPRTARVVPTPTRLLRSVMPVAAPFVVAEDFENGKRPAQQRIGTARGLDHDELAGARERGDLGRGERDDAVIIRQSRVGDHRGVDVDGHRRSIHLRHALPADADELGARRRPRRRVSHRARAAAESADPDPVVEHLALVPDARNSVRRPPRRDLLRGDGGARVLRARRVLARAG